MTDEEIARRCAEGLVMMKEHQPEGFSRPHEKWWWLFIADLATAEMNSEAGAAVAVDAYRERIAAAVLAAIREAHAPPAPSPVSDERLKEARDYAAQAKAENRGWIFVPHMEAQSAHIAHLESVVRWLAGERLCDGEDARRLIAEAEARGARRMKEACVKAANEAADGAVFGTYNPRKHSSKMGYPHCMVGRVAEAVEEAKGHGG